MQPYTAPRALDHSLHLFPAIRHPLPHSPSLETEAAAMNQAGFLGWRRLAFRSENDPPFFVRKTDTT